MGLIEELMVDLPDGRVVEVRIGLNWTAAVVETGGERRCGLASTLFAGHSYADDRAPVVPQAGHLERLPARGLVELAAGENPTLASVGVAVMNALLPQQREKWMEANAEELAARHGQGKRVVMVGHFPFAERLRSKVGELLILEQEPGPDDRPAEDAPEVIPGAEVVIITGMTLINHTLEGLLELCPPQALVILTGPSTPLSPRMFDFGVSIVSGAVVTDVKAVLRAVSQGANFRQMHQAGVRLVNLVKPGIKL